MVRISKYSRIRSEKSKDDQKEKMIILDKEGSIKTANGYGAISLAAGTYRCGKLPYFLKNHKTEKLYISRNLLVGGNLFVRA